MKSMIQSKHFKLLTNSNYDNFTLTSKRKNNFFKIASYFLKFYLAIY